MSEKIPIVPKSFHMEASPYEISDAEDLNLFTICDSDPLERSSEESASTDDENNSFNNDIADDNIAINYIMDASLQKNFPIIDVPDTPGITFLPSQLRPDKPIDAFNLMVTGSIYNLTVQQTNSNARRAIQSSQTSRASRLKDWTDTNVKEMKSFFSIVMYMGLVKYPSIELYWSKNILYRNSFVPKIMGRNRFQLLLKFLQFADSRQVTTDRLAKVRNLLSMLENNFIAAKIRESAAASEYILPWRGRLHLQHYNRGATQKCGVKVYKLCDPSGYTYASCIYDDKSDPTLMSGVDCGTKIKRNLAERYLMKRKTFANGMYSSVPLTKEFISKESSLSDALNQNIECSPEDLTKTMLGKNQSIGQENSDGSVTAQEDVATHPTELDSPSHGNERNVNSEKMQHPETAVCNSPEEGTATFDQHNCFSPLRKGIRWHHKVAFEFLLNTSVVNALILYKESQKKKQPMADFKQSIIESLSGIEVTPPQDSPTFGKHSLLEYEGKDRTNRKVRQRCSICYATLQKSVGRLEAARKAKRVRTYCDKCEGKPAFCLNCFNKCH